MALSPAAPWETFAKDDRVPEGAKRTAAMCQAYIILTELEFKEDELEDELLRDRAVANINVLWPGIKGIAHAMHEAATTAAEYLEGE